MKSPKKIFVVFGVVILILSFGLATVSATTDANEKKNTGISVEAKEKKISSLKVSWNANGGKIGSKKTIATSVKKGSKLKKLAATPKRTGFTFQGWYTKKSGGKKVTKNTKITKKVTFYAIWKKKSRTLNAAEKKLIGSWQWRNQYFNLLMNNIQIHTYTYMFRADGTFVFGYIRAAGSLSSSSSKSGKYKVSNGKITFTNVVWRKVEDGVYKNFPYPNTVVEYRFENLPGEGEYLKMARLDYPERTYIPLEDFWARWTKKT